MSTEGDQIVKNYKMKIEQFCWLSQTLPVKRETYLLNLCLLSDCFHFSIFVAKRKFFGLHLAKSWRIVDAWIIYEAESFGAKKLTLGQNSIFFQNRWFYSVKIQIIYFIKASFGAKIHIFHFLNFIFSAKIQICTSTFNFWRENSNISFLLKLHF